jgi:hypothetical protein
MSVWHCGSPGVSLIRANYEQVRQDMINVGYITDQEFAQDIGSLDNPAFMMPSPHHVDSMGASIEFLKCVSIGGGFLYTSFVRELGCDQSLLCIGPIGALSGWSANLPLFEAPAQSWGSMRSGH